MSEYKSILWTVKKATSDDWYESLVWLIYVLLGSLSPVYISVLILMIAGQSVSLIDFTRHAQFAIYSASILATSAHLICKDKKRPFPRRGIFIALVLLGLITSTALFASVTIFAKIQTIANFLKVDEQLVMNLSLIVFAISILMALFVNVLDSVIPPTEDIRRFEAEQREVLDEAFNKLGE